MKYNKIAFDIGNVLCHVDMDIFFDYLIDQKIFENNKDSFHFLNGYQHFQDIGVFNIKQGFHRFFPYLTNKDLENLYNVWMDVVSIPSEPVLELLEYLISNNYEIALLSNIGFDHCEFLKNKCNIFKKCIQHFSCEVKARKPNELFYKKFISKYNWSSECYFFDDRLDNITGSNGYLTGILFNLKNYNTDIEACNNIKKILDI